MVPFKLADIGEGITEVQILQWFVKEGTAVKQFEKIAEVQSDKATVEITSRYDGVVKKLHYSVNDMATVGEALVDIEIDGHVNVDKSATKSNAPDTSNSASSSSKMNQKQSSLQVMPSVRKLAQERGIDLSTVIGSGKDGRILLEDLPEKGSEKENVSKNTWSPAKHTIKSSLSSTSTLNLKYSPIHLNPIKKAMIKAMEASLSVPHFNYCDEYCFDSLLRARKQFIEGTGMKISVLPFILRAVSRATQDFPAINAHYFPKRQEFMAVHDHNIGIAVDTPLGLTVPVLKGVQSKKLAEIAAELHELTQRARQNLLKLEDFQDATISFSNIGSIGGTYASPLIVPPQVAIGALGRTRAQPTASSSTPSQIATISWAADHRVIDGAMMARFSNRVKELLESPLQLVLE
jgi:2-oxoisovalerate dehydrogenase E2 component (dihydrolipoyl transacylase)